MNTSDLNPDAVTFGKAVGGGVYPLAGVAVKEGGDELGAGGRGVLQMHTYAGSSARVGAWVGGWVNLMRGRLILMRGR